MFENLKNVNWLLVLVVLALSTMGFIMLYSAAGGSMQPWASKQLIRFMVAFIGMLIIACVNIRIWYQSAYWFYGACLFAIFLVEVTGSIGMGAQRWLDLGFIRIQPSELMKIGIILALARYFHRLPIEQVNRISNMIVPILIVFVPVAFILKQPDLGTSLVLIIGAISIFFLAGIRLWVFILAGVSTLSAIPILWINLHNYQKKRVLAFLNPEDDPLGTGYHVIQSKIALGSGGFWGKGLSQGTQSHLNFLPEKHTDFIFAMLAEEFGFIGGISVITLYFMIILIAFATSAYCRHQFGKLLAMGISITLFLYIFVNLGMVMNLLPVVGVPLPLLSYGGSALITSMLALGLLLSVHIHRDNWSSGLSE